jgi:DNA-binding MarR family transcriptional regulator
VISPFDREHQQLDVDSKIVVALERLSQAFRVLLWEQYRRHGLSPIQTQIITYLRFHPPEECTVGQLAAEFDLTQPTVSDAVRVLEDKGLVVRQRAESDRRRVVLRLTPTGRQRADELSTWADAFLNVNAGFSEEERAIVLRYLIDLIETLQRAGIITVARMCSTCRFFRRDHVPGALAPHYCTLLERPLAPSDLRVDCPEHQPAA